MEVIIVETVQLYGHFGGCSLWCCSAALRGVSNIIYINGDGPKVLSKTFMKGGFTAELLHQTGLA